MTYPYRYAWKRDAFTVPGWPAKRPTLHNRRCRVVHRLKRNSAVVEFENGQIEVVSRNALRKA